MGEGGLQRYFGKNSLEMPDNSLLIGIHTLSFSEADKSTVNKSDIYFALQAMLVWKRDLFSHAGCGLA